MQKKCVSYFLYSYSMQRVVGYGSWTTVLSAVLASAPTGYVMCSINDATPGTPSGCYLVDIYANRAATEAHDVVEMVQTEICDFLNPSTTPSSR